MTNHWNDLANSDCLLIIGCNPAENHPISFKWITKAMDKGAKLIVCDPRFTRSASKADLFIRLRPGTDIALMGGIINHVIQNNLYHQDYVVNYTNAPFLVNKDFGFADGLFSGYQKDKKAYDPATWSYELDAEKKPVQDPTLSNPRCVFQIAKAHYARYTPELVEATTGVPKEQLLKMAAIYAATGAPGKAGTILYAMGGTQHSTGVQIIRSYTILQQLLGNMGLPGGGINALRGENNVQGSTDMALLFNIVPGYMGIPSEAAHPTLKDYLEKETPKASFWINKPKFFVSLLKAFWGEAATKENDFAYDYLPKIGKGYEGVGYSWIPLFEAMGAGQIKGMLVWGMNPAVSSRQPQPDLRRPGPVGVAGGLRPLGDGHLGLLEAPRGGPQKNQDRGLSLPRGGRVGKRRLGLQLRPLAAVALPGGAGPRRRQERPVVRQPAGTGAEETLRRRPQGAHPRAHRQTFLALRRGPGRAPGGQGDQRLHRG